MIDLTAIGLQAEQGAQLIATVLDDYVKNGRPTTIDALAMVILGDLLDEGWRLPPALEPTPPDPDRPGQHLPRTNAPPFYRDLAPLARFSYDMGRAPQQLAARTVATLVRAWLVVCDGRAQDPACFPLWHRDLSAQAEGRRVIGALLDIGLTPPPNLHIGQLGRTS